MASRCSLLFLFYAFFHSTFLFLIHFGHFREKLAQEKNLLNENYQKIAGVLEETQKSLESVEAQKTTLGLKLMDLSSVNDALANQLQCKIEALKDCEMELDRVVSEKVLLLILLYRKDKHLITYLCVLKTCFILKFVRKDRFLRIDCQKMHCLKTLPIFPPFFDKN